MWGKERITSMFSAASDNTSMTPTAPRVLRTRGVSECRLPLFFPVYQPQSAIVPIEKWSEFGIEGCIVNAFFLYKNRETRAAFAAGEELHRYIGINGLVMTDSGAFQGFTRRLYLENKTIVAFQEQIGADIVSPLDLVTPPGDGRVVAERKLKVTMDRIREAKALVSRSILAGVQQGGRFLDLRRRSVEELMELGIEYIAVGSLVPFFNRNRNIGFVGRVLREARAIAGPSIPMHVYGAGDPVELPFLVALGADIFDSSSYGHYAAGGWYMTPFGALQDAARLIAGEYSCPCPTCAAVGELGDVFRSECGLAAHNLYTIVQTIRRIREALASGTLGQYLEQVLKQHTVWFPESALKESWELLNV